MTVPVNWPSTIEEVANDTMDLLGEDQTFSDLSADTTDNGLIIKRMIYRIIREVQGEFPWPELRALETIATPDPTFENTGEYDFSQRFDLPDDHLRVFNSERFRYEVIGPFVYANVTEDLQFHYGKYSETVSEWSAQLYNVTIFQLAIRVCLQITQSPALKAELLVDYEKRILPGAKAIRSQSMRHPNQRRRVQGHYGQARRNSGGRSGFIY